MSDFEIKGIVNEKEIPSSKTGTRLNYEPLFDKFDRISSGSSVHVRLKVKSRINGIQNAFEKKYGKSKFRISTRTIKDSEELDVYIIRK